MITVRPGQHLGVVYGVVLPLREAGADEEPVPAGEGDQSLRAWSGRHVLRERRGVRAAVSMNDQFREQHQVDILRRGAAAPHLDMLENALGFPEVPVHADGRDSSRPHRSFPVRSLGRRRTGGPTAVSAGVVPNSHRTEKLSDEPPDERTADGTLRNLLPQEVIEKTWEVADEKDEPEILEGNPEHAHRGHSLSKNQPGVTLTGRRGDKRPEI